MVIKSSGLEQESTEGLKNSWEILVCLEKVNNMNLPKIIAINVNNNKEKDYIESEATVFLIQCWL